jgi:phosphoesterase RecJ-like protein
MTDPYRRIIDSLAACSRVLITTHVRPDGDALGTTGALAMALRKIGIESQVLLLSRMPRKYAFLFQDNRIPFLDVEMGWPDDFSLDAFDALLVADTGTWSQLPGLEPRVAKFNKPKLVIDHHLTQENWATEKLVVTEAAAAGEIVAELLDQWPIEIDAAIASALYLAIASDTGWFQFSNTRPYTLRLAARLMEAGVETDRIYQLLYQNERAERVALQTRAQQSLELLSGGRLAVMRVGKSDFDETRADVPDTENLINVPLQIRTVEVSLLFVEPGEPGPIRVSLRSKGQVDVARFAEQFGGGGHARAAGLKLDGTLAEVRDRVVGEMETAMQAKL